METETPGPGLAVPSQATPPNPSQSCAAVILSGFLDWSSLPSALGFRPGIRPEPLDLARPSSWATRFSRLSMIDCCRMIKSRCWMIKSRRWTMMAIGVSRSAVLRSVPVSIPVIRHNHRGLHQLSPNQVPPIQHRDSEQLHEGCAGRLHIDGMLISSELPALGKAELNTPSFDNNGIRSAGEVSKLANRGTRPVKEKRCRPCVLPAFGGVGKTGFEAITHLAPEGLVLPITVFPPVGFAPMGYNHIGSDLGSCGTAHCVIYCQGMVCSPSVARDTWRDNWRRVPFLLVVGEGRCQCPQCLVSDRPSWPHCNARGRSNGQ